MKRLNKVLLVVSAASFFFGCSESPTMSKMNATGKQRISVNLGKVGLAKTAVSTLDSLVLDIVAPGEDPIRIVSLLSGVGQQSYMTELELACKPWNLSVRVYALRESGMMGSYPEITHQGVANFVVAEGNVNPPVNLGVDSRYANLIVYIGLLSDPANKVELRQGSSRDFPGQLLDDTTFAAVPKLPTDVVVLYYGWVQTNSWREDFQVGVYGMVDGNPSTLLNWGTFFFENVQPGIDGNTSFTLHNYAPGNTFGTQSVSVTIGAVGLLTATGTNSNELPPSGGGMLP